MSRAAYYTDFAAIPLLIAATVLYGAPTPGGVILGAAAWTLAEYVIHRFLFHRLPAFRDAHDRHHARPCARTGVTSWHSLAIFGALSLVLPAGVLTGLALGYLAYITVHHAVHHWRISPGHPLYGLKMRHALHHSGVEANFGVVTTFWDRALGTFVDRRR